MTGEPLPEFQETGIAAVRLLQGAIYQEEEAAWDVLLLHESDLATWFAKIGLVLVIDRAEGLAWLQQLSEDERSGGYERLPRLFRRTSLGYPATLLCVLLRDEYRRFEDEDVENERCVVGADSLLDAWRSFFPAKLDDVQLRRSLLTELNRLEKLKFVRKLETGMESWEIRKLLKARLPLENLEALRDRLQELAAATE